MSKAQEIEVLNILLMRGNASLLLKEVPQEEVLADLWINIKSFSVFLDIWQSKMVIF